MKLRAALVGSAVAALISLSFAGVAGGAPSEASNVGKVTVSTASPFREAVIEVSSTGWRPHGLVTITMSGVPGPLARASADAKGAVHAQVAIPADAPLGFDILAVNGATAAGVPQEIVTGLTVVRAGHEPRRVRPWTAVFSLAFFATLLMLASQKIMSRDGQAANPVATT
jgi:hypothetical protein